MHDLKIILSKILYNPYRVTRRNPHVRLGNSRLGKTFRVDFRVPRASDALAFIAGDDCILQCEAIFETSVGKITVGDGCFINGRTQIISISDVHIGHHVTIAWGCTIYDHNSHSIDYRERMEDQRRQLLDWSSGSFIASKNWDVVKRDPIRIEDHVWLGFDVVVLKGVTIGTGSVIAARSVVTTDIPPWTIAAGVPARVVAEIPLHLRKEG